MNALELNAEIYRSLGILSEDENMLKRAAKYLKRLAKELTYDPTCMTKEEYFRRLDEAEKGPARSFANIEELDRYIQSL